MTSEDSKRSILPATILLATLLASCGNPPPPAAPAVTPAVVPPAKPPFRTVVPTTRQFMEWVIDPAADAVWESVGTIMTKKGTKEIRPTTDEQWTRARNGAATLAEAANLLMLDGRARDNKGWMIRASRLIDAGEKALKAAEARDPDALFAVGSDIFNACDGCHLQYAPDAAPPAPEPAKK